MKESNHLFITILAAVVAYAFPSVAFAALSCSITASSTCSNPSVIVLRMSSTSNAHAELPSQSNAAYASNVVCCTGVTNLSNSCSGFTVATATDLSTVTNAHAEENTFSHFTNGACISAPSGTISIGYTGSIACTGYDTPLASLASPSNSHVGIPTAYPTNEICGKYLPSQALSYTLSASSVGFGNLTSVAARYATNDGLGASTPTIAHTLIVSTNASSGYSAVVQGATLTSGGNTITAIGGTNTASAPGTKQFGINVSALGGSGTVTAPYSGSGFAYAANVTTASQIASDSVGDGVNTTYSVEYLANISGSTSSSNYSTTLTYSVTANF